MSKATIFKSGKGGVAAALFALGFLLAVGPARAERKGAELSVVKTDGNELRGELIAVQGETLILLSDGLDAAVRLGEIDRLTVHKKSRTLGWRIDWDVFGTKSGTQGGEEAGDADQELWRRALAREATSTEAPLNVLNALVGALSGMEAGPDEHYSMDGITSPDQKREFLEHLNGLARVKSDR